MKLSDEAKAAINTALNFIREEAPKYTQAFTSAVSAEAFFTLRLTEESVECFEVLFLDNKNQFIECRRMSTGTINQASVYPREIAKTALELNACAIILAHNHPTGDPEPSDTDLRITNRIKDALGMLDIAVLDHIIVGHDSTYSFTNRGQL